MKIDIPINSFKAAIFDMDGTMINNMAYHKKAWQTFLAQHDIHLTEKEFHNKISGKKNDQIFEIVFGRKLDKDEERRYTEEKEALYRKLFKPDIKEIDGLFAVIDKLDKQNIKRQLYTWRYQTTKKK